MFSKLKKVMLAFVLLLVVASTGAWQSNNTALAAAGAPKIPLAPGLTWKNLGQTVRNIQLNIKGDALALSGATFRAAQKFPGEVPPAVSNFYSNVELYKSGWSSDNTFEAADGVHQIFYHDSGYYLAVEYLKCAGDANSTCITVWESAQKDTAKFIAGNNPTPQAEMGAAEAFTKAAPDNASTGINTNVLLSWNAYGPALKYSYCVKAWSECSVGDPNWTGTFLNTSTTISGLRLSKVYYWQVKAITDMNTLPKKYVLADGNTPWNFTTTDHSYTISGSVHTAGVVMHYTDLTDKTVTSNASGIYSFTVPYGWTGTVTPTKTGFTFDCGGGQEFLDFPDPITASQTGQNCAANQIYFAITGNVGVGGAILSYVDGTAKTATSLSDGSYTILVRYNWSGKITPKPSATVVSFVPAYTSYSHVLEDKDTQDYIANRIATFRSIGADDGYITESEADSGIGDLVNSTATTLRVGDTTQAQQLRAILSFDLSPLSATGGFTVVSAKLKLKLQSGKSNPFTNNFGQLVMETITPSFGDEELVSDDFESPGSPDAGFVSKNPVGGYYIGNVGSGGLADISAGALTQLKLSFQLGNNGNNIANYLAFYSGDAPLVYRPVLQVIYTVP